MIFLRQKCYRPWYFLLIILLSLFMLFCAGTPTRPLQARGVRGDISDKNIPVLTYKYNNQHTGENTGENVLNTSNVNARDFGQLFTYPVDGQIYAQPLYMPEMTINGQRLDLVIVATEHDNIYAFDADRISGTSAPIWKVSLLARGARPVSSRAVDCGNIMPEIGITSTPVIDPGTQTLFVVSYSQFHGHAFYQLHALDLRNGREKKGSPALVQGPGTFDSAAERQRAALLLANHGQIYLAFGSFCDHKAYHGWILSYRYNQRGFQEANAYNDTPDGREGGIWGDGSGIAADTDGHIYAMSGNGTFDLNRGGRDAGDSFIQLDANLHMLDYFAPYNESCLEDTDHDLGSGGPLLVPGDPASGHSAQVIGGGKEGRVYILDIHHMGHFHTLNHPCAHPGITRIDHTDQELRPHTVHAIFSTPAYWSGSNGSFIFLSGVQDHTRAFRLRNGHLYPTSATPEAFGYTGGNPVISSNGTTPGTGILWLLTPGSLRAYDATNLRVELYSSALPGYMKFSVPVVANGKVFVATRDELRIYGLLPTTKSP